MPQIHAAAHDHTYFGMALANLVRFDLGPRLAGMHKRKPCVASGPAVSASLRPIVSEALQMETAVKFWRFYF